MPEHVEKHVPTCRQTHLELQERNVEELMKVLQAKAVLHGGLGIAEVGRAWGPACRKDRPGIVVALGSVARPPWAEDCPWARLPWTPRGLSCLLQLTAHSGRTRASGPTTPGPSPKCQWALLS